MSQHRISNIRLNIGLDKIEKRVKGTIGVPKGKYGEISEIIRGMYAFVKSSVFAVRILENEWMQESVVYGCVKSLLLIPVALDLKFGKLIVPGKFALFL